MDRESKEWFAIKSIRKSKVSKIEVLKREIQILKEVKHPNIIALIDVFEDSKYLHLVTELCTGGELFDRIIAKTQSVEGHFSEHDAAQLVKDILDAITYCHDVKGIVHRDLKPENFLFLTKAEDSPIKIIDFGLSRHNDVNQGIMKTKVGKRAIISGYHETKTFERSLNSNLSLWKSQALLTMSHLKSLEGNTQKAATYGLLGLSLISCFVVIHLFMGIQILKFLIR
jgi:serine/threonine protein kinase